MRRDRFQGAIAGVGSTSGVRLVVGRWRRSPLGYFTDVMVAAADGHRVLLAPSREVADFVAETYSFDEVEVGAVTATSTLSGTWRVRAPGLDLHLRVGRRPLLGWLLRLVPRRLATSPAWTRVTDPVARVLLRGVRTRGTAAPGRREFYGATDVRRVAWLAGTWRGADLGALAPVAPEPGFGFGSTPARPSVTTLVSTVEVA